MINLKNNGKNIALWVIVGLLLISLFNVFHGNLQDDIKFLEFTDFITKVEDGGIKEVMIRGESVSGVFKNGDLFSTYVPSQYKDLVSKLMEKKIYIKQRPPEPPAQSLFSIFITLLPFLLLGGIWFFFFRQVQSNNGRAMGFGRSKAKRHDPQKNRITFIDVEGADEAKEDLKEVVDFLKEPSKFQKIGGKIPKGVLLIGPPGTGKTLLARAVAGEAQVPFFSISGSDFVEMFVGVGASRVRDLFDQAKESSPCIVFIDEIDAVGRHRGIGVGGGNDEREQTLNQLLVEMDGFNDKEDVIILAATNRSDVLDPALLRPGRFDRQIHVSLPDISGREKILDIHMKKIKLAPDSSSRNIARGTPGFSGADLANLVNEAALLAARRGKKVVDTRDFEDSKDKLIMGAERRSLRISDEEKKCTAYHEAGHTVVAYYSPDSDPIHKATIIPRGGALGMLVRLPEADRVSMAKPEILANIDVALGGRIAEEIIFGEDKVTSGAMCDFKQATRFARHMVIDWGMSESLGPISYASIYDNEEVYTPNRGRKLSEDIVKKIDAEIKSIIDKSYKRARGILEKHRAQLDLVANTLLEVETLTGDDIRSLITTGKLQPAEQKEQKKSKKKGVAASAAASAST